MILSGWGRYPRLECSVYRPRTEDELRSRVSQGRVIARGNGRAYGDSALSVANTVDMRAFNHLLAFDPETGQVTAEAGILLADIVHTFLPRGWFPFITPGTKFVTIGGMIAADVHGKNHHIDSSFGAFVDWFDVMGADGLVRRCSRETHPDLFFWTIGGMGLTGIILRAAFRLRPVESAWIKQTIKAAPNLYSAMDAFEVEQGTTYSVAWLDCMSSGEAMGRSLIILGDHALKGELHKPQSDGPYNAGPQKPQLTIPIELPISLLSGRTTKLFNYLYYAKGKLSPSTRFVDCDKYFYPLDRLGEWNRLYGRKGLAQFQCVLPLASARAGLKTILKKISNSRHGSFLAVLKRFGEQNSAFSFPMAGFTLALDFPINSHSLALLDELDRIVIDHEGRFYLAKDSRLSADALRRSDKRVEAFCEMRRRQNLSAAFASAQAERLQL
jgi:decaprenylphospho-beta-D-ribofuranose 2-oxidase